MKVEFEIQFDGDSIRIHNEEFVMEQLREKFKPGFLDATVENPFQWKSSEALGYLYAEIAKKALLGLKEMGFDIDDKKIAIKYIMENMTDDSGRPLDTWVDIIRKDGEIVSRTAKSISSMGKKELSELTSALIKFIVEWFQIDIQSPEDYKALMKTAK